MCARALNRFKEMIRVLVILSKSIQKRRRAVLAPGEAPENKEIVGRFPLSFSPPGPRRNTLVFRAKAHNVVNYPSSGLLLIDSGTIEYEVSRDCLEGDPNDFNDGSRRLFRV